MPWPQEEPVQDTQARFAAEFLRTPRGERSGLCRRQGISRKTAYKIVARYHACGTHGLGPRSSAPKTHPNAVDDAVVERVMAIRAASPGRSWAADKILWMWNDFHDDLKKPSRATVTRILTAYSTVKRRRRHLAHADSHRPPAAQFPNDVWALDGKGTWRGIDPLTVEDIHSRFLLDIANVPLRGDAIKRRCAKLFEAHGLPRRIRTDGGSPFAGSGVGKLSTLSLWWIKQGIDVEVVGKPQHNGHLERLHGTLEQEGSHDVDVDSALATFRDTYNNVRPHQELSGRRPVEAYRPVPSPPQKRPVPVFDDTRVVTTDGCFYWGGRLLFISEVLTSETITFRLLEPRLWLVRYRHLPLALFDETHQMLRRSPF